MNLQFDMGKYHFLIGTPWKKTFAIAVANVCINLLIYLFSLPNITAAFLLNLTVFLSPSGCCRVCCSVR